MVGKSEGMSVVRLKSHYSKITLKQKLINNVLFFGE